MPKYNNQKVQLYARVVHSAVNEDRRIGIKVSQEDFHCGLCNAQIKKGERFLLQTIVGKRRKLCIKCRQKILDAV